MSGSTHGERKLSRPALKASARPIEAGSAIVEGGGAWMAPGPASRLTNAVRPRGFRPCEMYRRAPSPASPHRLTRAAGLLLVAVCALACAAPLAAQQPARGAIAGVVVDSATGESRPGVTVLVVGPTRGALSDDRGRFLIADLAVGEHLVRTRALGYRESELRVAVRAGETTTVTLRVAAAPVTLGAVRARARAPERDRFELGPNVGTVSLTPSAVGAVPSVGEPDVLRTVQLLPGVNARNDFSSGYNVRGGESDQNLILLDGYPIYNP